LKNIPLGYGITMSGYVIEALPTERDQRDARMHIRVFSSLQSAGHADVALRCVMSFGDGFDEEQYVSELQPLGQGVFPTYHWQPGKFYMDDFMISLPSSLSRRPYRISFTAENVADR